MHCWGPTGGCDRQEPPGPLGARAPQGGPQVAPRGPRSPKGAHRGPLGPIGTHRDPLGPREPQSSSIGPSVPFEFRWPNGAQMQLIEAPRNMLPWLTAAIQCGKIGTGAHGILWHAVEFMAGMMELFDGVQTDPMVSSVKPIGPHNGPSPGTSHHPTRRTVTLSPSVESPR